MSQDGFAYAARAAALTEPTDWPSGYDWGTIAADPLNATWPTGWSAVRPASYTDGASAQGLTKIGSAGSSTASAAAALVAAWGNVTSATASATAGLADDSGATVAASYEYSAPTYRVSDPTITRPFYTATPPAGTVSVFVYWIGIYLNVYENPIATTIVNPPWLHTLYQSTTTPGTIAAADWSFGSLVATAAALSAGVSVSDDTTTIHGLTELSAFTAGVANYFQHRMDEAYPMHLLSPTWAADASFRKRVTFGAGGGTGLFYFVYSTS